MKARTIWDTDVWVRDSAFDTAAPDDQVLAWGNEQEFLLGSNKNTYVVKENLTVIERDLSEEEQGQEEDNEKVTENTGHSIGPHVTIPEDRKDFHEGDLVDITIPGIVSGSMGPINTKGLVGVYINNDYEVFVSKEQIVKRIELTPGAVYSLSGHKYILTVDNLFVGIAAEVTGDTLTLEQAQRDYNITKL